jgi:nucleoside-diphosphate-sugar epimerase
LAIIEDILKKKALIEYGPKVPGDQQNTNGDISKAILNLNYKPCVSLEEGLSQQINSYLKNDYFEVKR